MNSNTDALLIISEWQEIRSPDFAAIKSALKTLVIFDGRNFFEPKLVRGLGLEYLAMVR